MLNYVKQSHSMRKYPCNVFCHGLRIHPHIIWDPLFRSCENLFALILNMMVSSGCKFARHDSSAQLRDVWNYDLLSSLFLAATKQLYEWFSPSVCLSVCLSVCPSVCLSHLFDYVPIILSSWNFQELLPVTKVTSMQKVKVRGQRSRSQRSQPNLTVSGL